MISNKAVYLVVRTHYLEREVPAIKLVVYCGSKNKMNRRTIHTKIFTII